MVLKLDTVIPYGRSLDEYKTMFALSDADLQRQIVGVSDGPASFNAELSALGKKVVSVDPLYAFSAEQIESQCYALVEDIIAQVRATPGNWTWSYHRSPEHLQENRVKVLDTFIADYERGKVEGRYVVGELPTVGFASNQFDIALSSHFLFLYSDHLSYEFHRASVLELLRIASEVRIFPLLTLTLAVSPHVQPLLEELTTAKCTVRIEKVGYELQRGANKMLRIRKAA